MQLQQAFEVPSPVDDVWRWFKDVGGVIGCLPGASLRAPPDDGKLSLAMVVKLGPITANFVGDGQVRFDDAARGGVVEGAATDRKSASRIKGKVAFALSALTDAAPPMTRVALAIEYTMGGTLAQFAREGIVRDLAQRMTDAFATNLRRRLETFDAVAPTGSVAAANAAEGTPVPAAIGGTSSDDTAVAATTSTASAAAVCGSCEDMSVALPSPAPPPVESLDFGAMLLAVLKARLRRWFTRA